MKIKITTFFVSILFSFSTFSQEIDINSKSCAQKFSKEMHHLMDKSHQLILDGKIKGYHNDSFASIVPLNIYKTLARNSNYIKGKTAGSGYMTLGFCENVQFDYNSIEKKTEFSGFALYDAPYVDLNNGLQLPLSPLVYIKLSEIKNYFTVKELKWLHILKSFTSAPLCDLSSKEQISQHINKYNEISKNKGIAVLDTFIFGELFDQLYTTERLSIYKLKKNAEAPNDVEPAIDFYENALCTKKINWSDFIVENIKPVVINIHDWRFPDDPFALIDTSVLQRVSSGNSFLY